MQGWSAGSEFGEVAGVGRGVEEGGYGGRKSRSLVWRERLRKSWMVEEGKKGATELATRRGGGGGESVWWRRGRGG